MNAFTAHDLEAADLLARLDDDAPGPCGPPWSQLGRPVAGHDPGRARAHGRAAAASGPGRDQRRAQRGGRVTWPAPAGDRQPAGDDRGRVRPRPPAADACLDGRRLAPRIPRLRVPAGRCRSGGRDAAPFPARARTVSRPAPAAPHPGTTSTRPPAPIGQRLRPAPAVRARPGSASAPATARPDRQNPRGADCRRGKNPDHTATPDHAPNPSAPLGHLWCHAFDGCPEFWRGVAS